MDNSVAAINHIFVMRDIDLRLLDCFCILFDVCQNLICCYSVKVCSTFIKDIKLWLTKECSWPGKVAGTHHRRGRCHLSPIFVGENVIYRCGGMLTHFLNERIQETGLSECASHLFISYSSLNTINKIVANGTGKEERFLRQIAQLVCPVHADYTYQGRYQTQR